MAEGWNPWAQLRRRTHIVLRLLPLPDGIRGVYGRRDGRAAIILDSDLDRVERNAVLAHELVHDERGGGIDHDGMPTTWRAVVAREELIVDGEVARRLVPRAELLDFVERLATCQGVTALDVADEFGVPVSVAMCALEQLRSDAA